MSAMAHPYYHRCCRSPTLAPGYFHGEVVRVVAGLLVIVTGNPGVFQGYLYPTQQKPVPSPQVQVFSRLG